MFKKVDSSFSLKQTGKKETRLASPRSCLKQKFQDTKSKKEEEEETQFGDSSQRLPRFRDRITISAKLLNCNLQ